MLADGCPSPPLQRHLTTAAILRKTGQTPPLPPPGGSFLSQPLRLSAHSRPRNPSLLRVPRKAPTGSGTQASRRTHREGEKDENQTHGGETRGSEGRETVAGSEQRTEDQETGPGPEAGGDGRVNDHSAWSHHHHATHPRDALEAQPWVVATRGVTGARGEGAWGWGELSPLDPSNPATRSMAGRSAGSDTRETLLWNSGWGRSQTARLGLSVPRETGVGEGKELPSHLIPSHLPLLLSSPPEDC